MTESAAANSARPANPARPANSARPAQESAVRETVSQGNGGVVVRFSGRLVQSNPVRDQHGMVNFYENIIIVPAKDSYSHPTTYSVCAQGPLGPPETDITVTCSLSSWAKRTKSGVFYNMRLWHDA